MSRKPTTGRFATREELAYAVWWRYMETDLGIFGTAKVCGVSPYTVNRILHTKEGYDAYLKAKQAPETSAQNAEHEHRHQNTG